MKLFVLSDLHGSVSAFRAAEETFRREKAELLVLLGDYLNHGPRNALPEGYAPGELAPLLNAYKTRILAVRGNCDSEVDQMLLEFPMMADSAMILLGRLRVMAVHGHLYGPDRLPPAGSMEVLLSGHTHVPALEERDGVLFLNPGSPSIPKGGSEPGCAVLTEDVAELKTLEGETLKSLKLSNRSR